MKKLLLYSFLVFILHIPASASDQSDFEKHFKLFHQPQKIEFLSGKGISYGFLKSIFLEGTFPKPVLYGALKSLPLADQAGPGTLVLMLSDHPSLPDSPESYRLEIKDDGVVIRARGHAGLFYGCQTLQQLLEDSQ